MLTRTADHALRALLAIARHGGARPLRVGEVAELTGAPRNYLGKTLGALVKAGLLRSARGPLGGFTLAADAATISVARVADLFAESRGPRRCLLGGEACDPTRPCTAHDRWEALTTAVRAPLEQTTLADLLAGGGITTTYTLAAPPAAPTAGLVAGQP